MKCLAPLAAAVFLAAAAPAASQEQPQGERLLPGPETMEGVADILRETLARLAARLEPWREQLGRVLDDPGAYDAPVILPNGDILIRRKPEPEPEPPAPRPQRGAEADALDL